jgi:hypothetical protein
MSCPQPPGENRVARSIALKKIGSAEKNRVGQEPEPQLFFLRNMLQNYRVKINAFIVNNIIIKER